jgi:signal transduction histidine kinase
MWPMDYLLPGRASGEVGAVSIGPAMTTLRSVIARLAVVVRSAGIAYVAVQVAVWHSFYAADSWRLAGPVAAVLWAAVVTVYLRRRWPAPLFACIDAAVYVALALGLQWCVPAAVRYDALSWLVISMLSQLIVLAWYAHGTFAVPLALASPVAYLIGAERLAGADHRTTTTATILLCFVGGVHAYGRRVLYRRAAAADAALDEADRAVGEQYVILSRNIERREHERLLHDTVLNTLTALARTGSDDAAEVTSRCRQDVTLIEAVLGDRGDPDAGTDRPYGDLVNRVRAVAAEMRARGLNVYVETPDNWTPAVPAPVATAISNAVREALSNVVAHAGTADAWIQVGRIAPDPDGAGPSRLQVTVRDRGAGFDPARVDQGRLGLRRSIAERVADCGGQASISSAPGQGTLVCMSWPGQNGSASNGRVLSASNGRVRPASNGRPGPRRGEPAVLSHHEVARNTTEFGLLRMIAALAAILPSAALIDLLASLHDYRQPVVVAAVWLAMLPVAVWLVPRAGAAGLSRREAAAAVLIAVAAVAVIGSEHRPQHPLGVDLAVLGTVWLLALVALSGPAWAWIPGALIVFAVHAALLIHLEGADLLSLTQLEVAGYILLTALYVFSALRQSVAVNATMAARRASLASRSEAERAAAVAVVEDRRSRLALLEVEALPLLRGIADGTLDPTARDVRERCARLAAALRHSLSDRAPSSEGLVAGLAPALEAAIARGLLVHVQVLGDPPKPEPDVSHAVLAAVDAMISALAPQQVMLTVLASGDDVELYVTFSEPLPIVPDVAQFGRDVAAMTRWQASVTTEQTGAGCLEISWRKAVPA